MTPSSEKRVKILAVDDKPANLLALEAVLDDELYTLVTGPLGRHRARFARKESRHRPHPAGCADADHGRLRGGSPDKEDARLRGDSGDFITAVCTEDPSVRQGYEVGAVDYFSKPFDPEVLRRKVKVYASFQHKARLLVEKERQLAETEQLLRVARTHASLMETLNRC